MLQLQLFSVAAAPCAAHYVVVYEAVKSWKTISMAMIANVWANKRAMIIAVNIFGALEGFLPKALILE